MSPSILVCADRHDSFRDSDIFAAVAVLEYLLEKGEIDGALKDVVSDWRSELGRSGPGTIDLGLDAIETDLSVRRRLAGALAYSAERAKSEWSGEIPASVLNRFDPFQVRFSSYSVSDISRVFMRLHRLLEGATAVDEIS